MLVGHGEPIARLIASHSETVDFVHQYRMHDRAHDYAWEERWVRDEGYLKIVPRAVAALLAKCGVEAGAITHFCMPGTLSRIGAAVAKRCGLNDGAVRDNLAAVCGDTGVAHPLLMLAAALEDAKPGDRILLAAFGEGCDALLFEVTAGHRQAERAPRREGRARGAARGQQLHALPVLQRPDRPGARHARRARQAHADDGAVPQPRHDPGPGGRQVPRLRHGAVPAPALLRQPGVQRARQPGRLCVLRALRHADVLHRRLADLQPRPAHLLRHGAVRRRRAHADGLQRGRGRQDRRRAAGADGVPHQGRRSDARLRALFLEGAPRPRP